MRNWSSTENEAMRGYIVYAGKLLTEDSESGFTDDHLRMILRKLFRATDEMTAEQARNFYLNSEY